LTVLKANPPLLLTNIQQHQKAVARALVLVVEAATAPVAQRVVMVVPHTTIAFTNLLLGGVLILLGVALQPLMPDKRLLRPSLRLQRRTLLLIAMEHWLRARTVGQL
jgi:hypothetical protein